MLAVAFQIALILVCGMHILLRRYRQPESRMAWLVVLIALPYAGALAYLLLGSTNVGRRRIARLRDTTDILPRPDDAPGISSSKRARNLPHLTSILKPHAGERRRTGAKYHV